MKNFSYNKTLNIYFSEDYNYINDSLDEILILANLKDYKVSIIEARRSYKTIKNPLAEVIIEKNKQYLSLMFYFDHFENNNQNIYLFNETLYIYDNSYRVSHSENVKNKLKKIKEML